MKTRQVLLCSFLLLCIASFSYAQDIELLNKEVAGLIEKEEFKEAHKLLTKIIDLQKSPKDSLVFAETLHYLGKYLYEAGQYDSANDILTKSLRIKKELCSTLTPEYIETLYITGQIFSDKQMFPQAQKRFTQVMKYYERLSGKSSIGYVKTLCQLGKLHLYLSDLPKGKELLDEASQLEKTLSQKDIKLSISILRETATYYFFLNDLTQSKNYITKASDLASKHFGKESIEYTRCRLTLSVVYMTQGELIKAMDIFDEALATYKKRGIISHPDMLSIYTNQGVISLMMGNYEQTSSYLEEKLPIIEKDVGKNHSYYQHSINTLASAYQQLGYYEKAEALYIESLNFRKKTYGEESREVVRIMNNLATLYQDTRNYEKVAEIAEQTFELSQKHNYKDTYIQSCSLLGFISYINGVYEDAAKFHQEALNVYEEIVGKGGSSFIQLLGNVVNALVEIEGSNPEDEDFILQLLEFDSKVHEKGNIAHIKSIQSTGYYYFNQKKHSKALEYYLKAEELLESKKDKELYNLNFNIYSKIALLKAEENSYTQAASYYEKALEMAKAECKQYFTFLSEIEREQSMKRQKLFFNNIKSFAHKQKENNLPATEIVYNTELFHKGLLVNSTTHIQQSFLQSDTLAYQWAQLMVLKEQRIKQETSSNPSEENLSKLKNKIQELEKELTRNSKQYRDLQEEYSYTWKDIKNALKAQEAAVEFVSYEKKDAQEILTGEKIYYALLLRPEYERPQLILCCNETELQEAINLSSTNDALYKLLWQSLDEELQGVTDIFIAPTGLLHYVPFNALKDNNNQYLIDKYSIRQVMSTRDVIALKNEQKINHTPPSIALFGGSDYDLSNREMSTLYAELEKQPTNNDLMRSVLDSLDIDRGRGFDYLPGSKKEVEIIGSILSNRQWNVSLYTDKQATEAHFKNLSSQSPAVIHISTHGFYFPQFEKKENQKNNIYKISKNPLIRSGLLFTGANNMWNAPETVTDQPEDGILTAYEISNLNLTNTRLAVLSACNTGKGEIMNNEGTYGLQRAFRLAGVQSMIITLWEISDSDTVTFMAEFYNQWTAGNSLRDAFASAQKRLKGIYPNQVEKWAGFVLVE